MKKALAILMAIAMIVPAVFAIGPAPEVTFGVSADAEVQMIKENTVKSYEETGDVNQPKASFNPYGLKATKLVSNDWANFDWAPMSIKAEAKYDAYRASADDFSWLKVTATWKDLFGFKIAYEFVQDNKEGAAAPDAVLSKNTGNNISATYDKDGVKFWTKYDADAILDMASTTVGAEVDSFMTDFKEIGFAFTNDDIATNLVYKNMGLGTQTIDAATIEAKKMFGFWNVLMNNGDEIGYRLGNLGSDSKIDRPEFKIGKDNKIQANGKMNAKNTMTFGENLTVKATLVVPGADETFTDWLKGDNVIIGAEYVLADVGTIGAGAKITQDYNVGTGTVSGPSLFVVDGKTGIQWGNAIWVDAKLDKLLGADKAVFVGVDAQFGAYNQTYETGKHSDAAKVNEMKVGMATRASVYGETKMKLSDPLSFSAGLLFKLGMGYDYKSTHASGESWSTANPKDEKTKWYSGYTEANALNATYDIVPFELKVRGDYKVNDTISVWASDNFKANDGAFGDQPDGDGKTVVGFYQKNVIGLGAKIKATAKSSLSVSTDVNLFLGLPSSSDLYKSKADWNSAASNEDYDAYKKKLDAEVSVWKSTKFNPFAVKVAYSFAY